MKVFTGILVLFAIYLTFWVEQNNSDYSNSAGNCYNYSYYIQCYIYNNDIQAIKSLLRNGSKGTVDTFYITKQYSLVKGNLTLHIEISQNIRYLILDLSYSFNQEQIILIASSINTQIISLRCDQPVRLESPNFFNQFVGLTRIILLDVITNNFPSFSQLDNLDALVVSIKSGGNQVLESSFFSAITPLRYLDLGYSSFTSISERTFENMDNLQSLLLDHIKIRSLGDKTFRGLTKLGYLSLEDSELQDVSYNAFEDLNKLTYLNLNENPEFPLPAILNLQNLENLYINFNNYHTVEPYVFQQMKKLTRIYMNNPFTCDCNLKWTSIVSQFGIYIIGSYCLDPIDKFGRLITNEDSYTNCTQTESYLCFDSSSICENDEVCHNTQDSYYCGCPVGYDYNNIRHCGDINECDGANKCQHSCENTEGTFYCVCNEGYKLSDNGYDCEDINECRELNVDCEYGCKNSIGSYQCYCEVGHQLYNRTSCNSDFQCELIGNSYDPLNCINESGSFLNCNSGLNFSVLNLPCVSCVVQSTSTQEATVTSLLESSEWANPTLILLITLIIIIGIQTIIIVIILIVCILKKKKNLKSNITIPVMNAQNLPNHVPIQFDNEIFKDEIQNPEKPSPTHQVVINPTEMPSNMAFPEPYGKEGTVYMSMS